MFSAARNRCIKMARIEIDTFEELESFLRNWTSFKDDQAYDLIGVAALMAACLDNLSSNVVDGDVGEIADCFTDSQKVFLRKMVRTL
jgi:hypothetical protein